ncbi:MAG: carbamoyl-phosphate synthase large subunit, partial [Xanthomonadaceae bacterium]|nr:carbamoyl-phosphate synthase large subunit [Xanthomonadaceae bacterium]
LYVAEAFRRGIDFDEVQRLSRIDHWFLDQILEIVEMEHALQDDGLDSLDATHLYKLKRHGFSDARLARLLTTSEHAIRHLRQTLDVERVYKRVDTCAAEFATTTAYLYGTWEQQCEARPSSRRKIMVLGGGPNRIGQGIEFDYCCVHAAMAMRELDFETIMVNCNPETVSTDYDTSDRLYFEPLTLEDVLAVINLEKPDGVIVQFGGQTPLKLARDLEAAGVPIIGTSPDSIDLAEDRERFGVLLSRLGLKQPPNRTARTTEEAVVLAQEVGFPLVVRPSYVLGGRAMDVVHSVDELKRYMREAVSVSNDSPVLLDRFLDHAIEVDVDAVCDGERVVIGGIMEHIEQAGVHSGDSSCSLPPFSLKPEIIAEIASQTRQMALAMKVIGLMNVQFAVRGDDIFVLEVNPRASRTVPFVSKATGTPLAKVAARCMVGESLEKQGIVEDLETRFYSIKEPAFPFIKFPGVDPILGPEMRSTGECMGVGESFGAAVARGQQGVGIQAAASGRAFVSVRDADKQQLLPVARDMVERGFTLVATEGTWKFLVENGIECDYINKVVQGRPHIVDMIKNREIDYIVNTTEGRQAITDSYSIRREALQRKVNYSTTIAGARATLKALEHWHERKVASLAELHAK